MDYLAEASPEQKRLGTIYVQMRALAEAAGLNGAFVRGRWPGRLLLTWCPDQRA